MPKPKDAAEVPPPPSPAPVETHSSRLSPEPPKPREHWGSPGSDSLRRAQAQSRKSVEKRVREGEVEPSPRPDEVNSVRGEGRASFSRKRGTGEECTSQRATSTPGSRLRVPVSRSLPQHPACPGSSVPGTPGLGYSQSPGLSVVFHHGGCDGVIPGQGGGQGWGGEGVGRKGRGAPGSGWGQRKRY